MKKKSFILIAVLIISLLVGCATDTTPEQGNGLENGNGTGAGIGNENATGKPETVVSKEIPDTFPDEIVPLYEVEEVEGVIAVGDDYYQAYYFSNMEKEELVEKYREFYKDNDVSIHENESSYELSGNVDGNKIRMYIMPYNAEDIAGTTENTTEDTTSPNSFATTVIIFIYADEAVNAG